MCEIVNKLSDYDCHITVICWLRNDLSLTLIYRLNYTSFFTTTTVNANLKTEQTPGTIHSMVCVINKHGFYRAMLR